MHMSIHMHIAELWREMATVERSDIAHKVGSRSGNVNGKPPSRGAMAAMSARSVGPYFR